MSKNFKDIPLSHSSVSLRLADIQKRCAELLEEPGTLGGLSLEEPVDVPEENDPYNLGG